ncbi:hypothetical protein Ancab_027598 [Ancistrocladus abbreviatus]
MAAMDVESVQGERDGKYHFRGVLGVNLQSLIHQTHGQDHRKRRATGNGIGTNQSPSIRRSECKSELMAREQKVSNSIGEVEIKIKKEKNTESSREVVTANANGVSESNFLPSRGTRSSSNGRNHKNYRVNVIDHDKDLMKANFSQSRGSRSNNSQNKNCGITEVVDVEKNDALKKEILLSNRGTNKGAPISVEEYFGDKACKLSFLDFQFKTPESKITIANVASRSQLIDDDDDIRILPSKRVKTYFSRKWEARKPFRGPSVTEVGESSSPIVEENGEEGKVKTFACEICAEDTPQDESFTVKGCTHSYCIDCTRNYIVSKLDNGVSQINCLAPSCSGFLEPEYCRRILASEVFDRWGTMLCESMILASQKFYCPFKDCSALLVDDGGEVVTRSECPCCWRLFCAQCKSIWHEGIACTEFQKLDKAERAREDIMLRDLAKKQSWQRCPMCKVYVEKIAGCLFMKCRCGVAFCYNCGNLHTDRAYHYCSKCKH